MPSRFPSLRLVASVVPLGMLLVALLCPLAASAQEDAPSLGDLARDVRKNRLQQPQPQTDPARPVPALPVIDNDNLAQVMDDAKKARPVKPDKTVFSIDPSGNTLKISSPDVTCSLSLTPVPVRCWSGRFSSKTCRSPNCSSSTAPVPFRMKVCNWKYSTEPIGTFAKSPLA